MKIKSRQNMNPYFRWMPNGMIHILLILIFPIYILGVVGNHSLKELLTDWWDDFWAYYK